MKKALIFPGVAFLLSARTPEKTKAHRVLHAASRPVSCPLTETFSTHSIPLETSAHPQSIATGDFDDDGFADLVTVNRGAVGSGDGVADVLINNETGGFDPRAPYSSGGVYPVFVLVGSFGSDTLPDLAIANQDSPNMTILRNQGSGSVCGEFCIISMTLMTNLMPHGIAKGIFDSDSFIDLALANIGDPSMDTGNLQTFVGNSDGSFMTAVDHDAGDQPHAVGAANFTSASDSLTDLLVANGGSWSDGTADHQLTLLKGSSIGFVTPNCTAHPEFCPQTKKKPVNLIAGDFGNGFQDFAAANLLDNMGRATVGVGDGTGAFTLQNLSTGVAGCSAGDETASAVAVGDIDGDGNVDLVVTNFCQNSVSIFTGDGSGMFCSTPLTVMLGTNRGPRSVVIFHLTHGTMKHDIAVANDLNNSVYVLSPN